MATAKATEETGRQFAQKWISMFRRGEHERLFQELISPKLRFFSPVVHKPYTDPLTISVILKSIVEVLDEFQYEASYVSTAAGSAGEVGVVLMFSGYVTSDKGRRLRVEGVDIFKVDGAGVAVELRVMLRPLSATVVVSKNMKGKLMQYANL